MSMRSSQDYSRLSIIKPDDVRFSGQSSPKRSSPQKRAPLPIIANLDIESLNIIDLLSKLNSYIDQNKLNMPAFNTSEEAKQELKNLQIQLQDNQKKTSIKSKRTDFSSKLAEITKQHKVIEEENEKISSFRQTSKEARDHDEEEYKQMKLQIADSMKKLNEARNKKSTEDSQLTRLQSSIETLEKTYSTILSQNQQLQSQEKQLQSTQRQIKLDLQSLESKNAGCEREEATLDALDKATAEKMGKIRQLQKDLASKQAIIAQLQADIKQLSDVAEKVEIHYEDVLARASNFSELDSPYKKSESYEPQSDILSSPYKSEISQPATPIQYKFEEEEDYEAILNDDTDLHQTHDDLLKSDNEADDLSIEDLKSKIKSFSQSQMSENTVHEEEEDENFYPEVYHSPIKSDVYNSPIKSVSQQYSSILQSALEEEEDFVDDIAEDDLEKRYMSALQDSDNGEEESEDAIIKEALRVVNYSVQDPKDIISKY